MSETIGKAPSQVGPESLQSDVCECKRPKTPGQPLCPICHDKEDRQFQSED